MQTILEQNYIADKIINKTDGIFGGKIGILASVFGCWHKQLSRPFTNANESFRVCIECGARRRFDANILKTFNSFYYPPTVLPVSNKR